MIREFFCECPRFQLIPAADFQSENNSLNGMTSFELSAVADGMRFVIAVTWNG